MNLMDKCKGQGHTSQGHGHTRARSRSLKYRKAYKIQFCDMFPGMHVDVLEERSLRSRSRTHDF